MTTAILLLSALTILASCNNNKHSTDNVLFTNNSKLDTVKPVIVTSFNAVAYPGIFQAAFNSETKVTQGDITYIFYKIDIGKMKVESGKLIACDPIVMHDASPFTQNFPIGDFAVHLAMSKHIMTKELLSVELYSLTVK